MLETIVGVLLVNLGVLLCVLLLRRLAESFVRQAAVGYYIVLLPAGVVTWRHPELFYVAGFVLLGLVMITSTARRALRERAKGDV